MAENHLLTAVVCVALVGGAGPAFASNDATIENAMETSMDMQALLEECIGDSGAVGASVGLIDRGTIQFFSCGKKSVDRGGAVSENTLFEIGSITKVFTTMVLMDMVAKGEVQLDDPIEKYLPGIKLPELEGRKITLRHLAAHTSGLPRLPDHFDPRNPANPYEDYTVERLYDDLNHCILNMAPGDSFEYSNIGMGLLGHILSQRSGKSYEELVRNLIAKELEMPATSIVPTAAIASDFAVGHHLKQEVGYWDMPALAGAGALRSNVKDMVRFLAANMGLSPSPLTNLLRKCHQKQCAPFPAFAVGLGWMVSNSDTAELVWHNGGTGGFRSYLGFNPGTQKGVVVLSNSTEDWPDEFGRLLLDPGYKRPLMDKTLASDPDYLNRFAGSYEATLAGDPSKQQLQISVFGKLLGSRLSGGEVGMLYPESFGIFGVRGFPDGKVHFSFDAQGIVSKVQACLLSNNSVLWEAVPLRKE